MLSKLSQDDVSSLATLGRSVLHDAALTTCILKVVNSTSYCGVNRVTTVSRACVILGFKALRNICLTTKLLGSLLRSETLTKRVYIELVKLMSQSFHAAMLAKMIMVDYDDDTQEEIFIATLLYRLGENAFWSLGGKYTEILEQKLRGVTDLAQREKIAQAVIGTTFNELNIGLASDWQLSDVLIKALHQPQQRTNELQVIKLANSLSRSLVSGYHNPSKRNDYLKAISQFMNIDMDTTLKRVNQCNKETIELLDSFGMAILKKFISDEKVAYLNIKEQKQTVEVEPNRVDPQTYILQIKLLRQLAFSTEVAGGFNQVMASTIEGITQAITMERVLVLMFNTDKTALTPRFHNNDCSQQTIRDFTLQLYNKDNLFLYVANELMPVWVREQTGEKYKKLLTPALEAIVCNKGFLVSPLMLKGQCIGIIYADRNKTKRMIRSEDFEAFTHFAQLANLCLSAALKARSSHS